jgi:hypothetical protein
MIDGRMFINKMIVFLKFNKMINEKCSFTFKKDGLTKIIKYL